MRGASHLEWNGLRDYSLFMAQECNMRKLTPQIDHVYVGDINFKSELQCSNDCIMYRG